MKILITFHLRQGSCKLLGVNEEAFVPGLPWKEGFHYSAESTGEHCLQWSCSTAWRKWERCMGGLLTSACKDWNLFSSHRRYATATGDRLSLSNLESSLWSWSISPKKNDKILTDLNSYFCPLMLLLWMQTERDWEVVQYEVRNWPNDCHMQQPSTIIMVMNKVITRRQTNGNGLVVIHCT